MIFTAGRLKAVGVFVGRLGVSAFAVWCILRFTEIDSIWANLKLSSWLGCVILSLLMVSHVLLCVWRWRAILKEIFNCEVGFRRLSFLFGISEVVGNVLPSFVGMDLLRAGALARSVSIAVAARSVICDRILGLLTLVIVMTCGLPGFAVFIDHGLALYAVSGLCFAALFGFLAVVLARPWLRRFRVLANTIDPLVGDVIRALSTRALIVPAFVSGLLIHIISAALLWASGLAIGVDLGLVYCLLIGPAAFLVSAAPISLAGWGVREGALAAGFGLVGADANQVIASSVLYGLTTFVTGAFAMVLGLVPESGPKRCQLV
ncbi:lysylphosphatidylglycerol synthase transmembrane domain-containing protein [Dongia sp.]|uniref:lysylphosphatidylglycerol synthase transmembrane domain-containing protein n=1 Tax=Dongia sp. TaxID=1977262 RepID=UPI003750F963